MAALSTYANLTGDRGVDIAALAARMAEQWPASANKAQEVATREIDGAYAEIAAAPSVKVADAAEDHTFVELMRAPRSKAARNAHDAAKRVRLAAYAKERLEGLV